MSERPEPVDPFVLGQFAAETARRSAVSHPQVSTAQGAPADLLEALDAAVEQMSAELVSASHDLSEHPEVRLRGAPLRRRARRPRARPRGRRRGRRRGPGDRGARRVRHPGRPDDRDPVRIRRAPRDRPWLRAQHHRPHRPRRVPRTAPRGRPSARARRVARHPRGGGRLRQGVHGPRGRLRRHRRRDHGPPLHVRPRRHRLPRAAPAPRDLPRAHLPRLGPAVHGAQRSRRREPRLHRGRAVPAADAADRSGPLRRERRRAAAQRHPRPRRTVLLPAQSVPAEPQAPQRAARGDHARRRAHGRLHGDAHLGRSAALPAAARQRAAVAGLEPALRRPRTRDGVAGRHPEHLRGLDGLRQHLLPDARPARDGEDRRPRTQPAHPRIRRRRSDPRRRSGPPRCGDLARRGGGGLSLRPRTARPGRRGLRRGGRRHRRAGLFRLTPSSTDPEPQPHEGPIERQRAP